MGEGTFFGVESAMRDDVYDATLTVESQKAEVPQRSGKAQHRAAYAQGAAGAPLRRHVTWSGSALYI